MTEEIRNVSENIKIEVTYTGTKLGSQFNIKDPIPKMHNHDIIYHIVCLKNNCNEDYIGECARRLNERTKDHNGRDKNSYLTLLNRKLTYEVSEWDFQIIEKAYHHHTWRWEFFQKLYLSRTKSHH